MDDLLDISRIVLGKLRIGREAVDVGKVVAAAIDVVRPAAEQQEVRLETNLPEGPAVIVGDGNRLQQVVWNLLTNALKFTPAGGRIHVAAEATPDGVQIRVRDTGTGIDPALLPVIFERFRQAGGEARKGGLGLGLSIAREIVTLHGGTIDAANARNGGAVFTIRLPRDHRPADKP